MVPDLQQIILKRGSNVKISIDLEFQDYFLISTQLE